jgi:beta-glucosidase
MTGPSMEMRAMGKGASALLLVAALMLLQACSRSSGPLEAGPGAPQGSRCGDVKERPWCDASLDPQARTELLLSRMTLAQKIGLMAGGDSGSVDGAPAPQGRLHGIPELGIPDLNMANSVAGSNVAPSTAIPAPLSLAASFDRQLARKIAATVGTEGKYRGIDVVLAPSVDVMRTALHGRSFESYGEDPYLAGELGVEWVRGVQAQGLIANLKHYAVNTQEGRIQVVPLVPLLGMRYLVDAVVDERTLREIYLPPFEAVVKRGEVGSVMCAYNRVNGSPACSSRYLLQEVLRDDWGFDGFVVSDWDTAVKDTVNSANNGLDLEMPSTKFYIPALLQLALASGAVSEETIDERVGNTLRTMFRHGVFDRPAFPADDSLIDWAAHQDAAREASEKGTVLLRNEGLLPLDAGAVRKIVLLGRGAVVNQFGYGSSQVSPIRYVSPLEAIRERAGPGVEVVHDSGDDPARAAELAADADAAIVFAADLSMEGVDRLCLSLDCSLTGLPLSALLNPLYDAVYPDAPSQQIPELFVRYLQELLSDRRQDELISQVAAANPRTVAVLNVGGPVLTPWREQVAALLVPWYPGQEAGGAIARLLFGDTDPGGRLPVSFPEAAGDTPTANNPFQYPGVLERAEYSEGVFIGYRWHDREKVAPAYAFGEGLSYTQFDYGELAVTPAADVVRLHLQVRNRGARAGWAVPQVYLSLPAPSAELPQPPKALKGFDKRWLRPGQQARFEFTLDRRALSYWDPGSHEWRVQPGCYRVMAGPSSRELPLSASLTVDGQGRAAVSACGSG